MNRIARHIEWDVISKGLPSGRASANDKAPTAEELRRLIDDDLRLKVIVCIMAACGMRLGAWNHLKVKHIMPIKRGDVTLAQIIVYAGQYRGKSKQYYILITPEAYQTFQEYLASRSAAGEITLNVKNKVPS
jgi:integrase